MKTKASLGILTITLAFAVQVQAQSFLTNGLVAYYPFNGDANDASGNGNDGTVVGAILTTNRFGYPNSAYNFNGVSSYIQIPETLFGSSNAGVTISVWVTSDSGPYTSQQSIFYKSSQNGEMQFVFQASGQIAFGPNLSSTWYLATTPLPLNSPMHLVGVYQKGQSVSLYINGVLTNSVSVPDDTLVVVPGSNYRSAIGMYDFVPSPYQAFRGIIDDVRVYARALSSSEVQQLYAYESVPSQYVLTNGLVAYYPFNGNANDATGNGNNGSVNGTMLTTDRFDIPNSAYAFPGIGLTNITINTTNLELQPPFSCSLWVNYVGGTGNPRFIATGSWGIGLNWPGVTRPIHFGMITTSGNYECPSTGTFTQGIWQQVVAVRSTNAMMLYVDGQLKNTVAVSDPLVYESGFGSIWLPTIGGSETIGYPGDSFEGSIDEIRIYSRALSDSEVRQLYAYESVAQCVSHAATATAIVAYGFVVAATITDGGCGYTNTPLVLIQGGGGAGATATAIVSNGVVVGITITDAGFGYTSTPTILVGSMPVIGSQPQSITVNAGDNAPFTVTDTELTPASFQWSFDGTNIDGATSSTLTVSNVSQSDLGVYAVVITNPFGSVTSSNAILSMYPYLAAPFGGAVTYWGTNVTFGVEAWGSGPLTYQWFVDGAAIVDATNAVLNFTSIQFTNAGLYWVVVSNPFGSVTNEPAQVVVNPAGVSIGLYPGVTINGVVGVNYLIQRTANLNDTNSWVNVANVTLAQPVQLWVDTNINTSLPANPQNYYRVLPGQ